MVTDNGYVMSYSTEAVVPERNCLWLADSIPEGPGPHGVPTQDSRPDVNGAHNLLAHTTPTPLLHTPTVTLSDYPLSLIYTLYIVGTFSAKATMG